MYWLVLTLAAAPQAAQSFRGSTYYLGDPHAHTGVSLDGCSQELGGGPYCGAFEELPELAAAEGLDWYALTEHSNGPLAAAEEQFHMELDAVAAWSQQEGPLVIQGAEVWFEGPEGPIGHRNLYFFGSDEQLAGLHYDDTAPIDHQVKRVESCEQIGDWLEELEARFGPLAMVAHHPALESPMPADWDCFHERWELAVEVYSAWGNSLGGPIGGWDPPVQPLEPAGTVANAMDPDGLALRFAFLGGTDNHKTHPGNLCQMGPRHATTGGASVLVLPEGEELDRDAVYQALADRSVYATSGPMVPVDLEYWAGGHHLGGLGDELDLPEGLDLEVAVHLPDAALDAVVEVVLVGPDGSWELEPESGGGFAVELTPEEVPAWIYAAVRLDGAAFYSEQHLERCDDTGSDDDEWLWMSPSWIEIVPGLTTGTLLFLAGAPEVEAEDIPAARCAHRQAPTGAGWLAMLVGMLVGWRRILGAPFSAPPSSPPPP